MTLLERDLDYEPFDYVLLETVDRTQNAAAGPTACLTDAESWTNPSRASRLGVSPSYAAKSHAKAQSPPKKSRAALLTTVPLVWYTGDHKRAPHTRAPQATAVWQFGYHYPTVAPRPRWFELSVSLSARCAAAAFVSSTPGTPRTINPRNRGVFACHARFGLRHFVRLFSRISSPLPGHKPRFYVSNDSPPAKTRPRKFSLSRFSWDKRTNAPRSRSAAS